MSKKGFSLLKTIMLFKRMRGAVLNNRGFQTQLVQFARKCGLLDSREEVAKLLENTNGRNGLWQYIDEKKLRSEKKSTNDCREIVGSSLMNKPPLPMKRGVFTGTVNKKPSSREHNSFCKETGPCQSDTLIENYMSRLVQRSFEV